MGEQQRIPIAKPADNAQPLAPPQTKSAETSGTVLPLQTLDSPRFWALPDPNLGYWVVCENESTATSLAGAKPKIYMPTMDTAAKASAAERCKALIGSRLRDVFQDDLFNFIKRMMLGGMLTVAGIFGLRLGGPLEILDTVLLAGGLGYTIYAVGRYGVRPLHSLEKLNRPFSQFAGEPFVQNKLSERLAKALEFRRTVSPDKRGDSPDDELLDASAYRKLIREGVTTRRELVALGAAIDARMGLNNPEAKHLAEIARIEGLEQNAAALYRDLAQAAREIALEPDGMFD